MGIKIKSGTFAITSEQSRESIKYPNFRLKKKSKFWINPPKGMDARMVPQLSLSHSKMIHKEWL
jgi:hypothetical protein